MTTLEADTRTGTLDDEIGRRRTFAIISHPDAGKTTLTEKLLLYGGAIHAAGAVKARRTSRHATSDWMAIEKERGISVATSVMRFEHGGMRFNLLDTPGHNDFSEDTYRTLAAADCAVMLVDNAKGVEPQTIKLFEVCRRRGLPIVTFVNKLDREGKPYLDLLDEIETVLGIPTAPMTWPVGHGREFRGVVDRETHAFLAFERDGRENRAAMTTTSLHDAAVRAELGPSVLAEVEGELALLEDAGNPFNEERFLKGELSPTFFGSAMTNFGVEPFLERFASLCPSPAPRTSRGVSIDAEDAAFSGFVFKIQANMDPRHRDRVAFLRVCSGRFERGMSVVHTRTGKKMTLDRSLHFFAQSREQVDEAFAGDIVGLWDSGNLRIGDTLATRSDIEFEGVPRFSPEIFVRVRVKDPMKRKQMKKGLEQLSDEGAVQLLRERDEYAVDPVLGAVGWLQIEVVQHRLKAEYGVETELTRLPYSEARWVFGPPFDASKVTRQGSVECLLDIEERPLLLFDSPWTRRRIEERMEGYTFEAAVQPGRSR